MLATNNETEWMLPVQYSKASICSVWFVKMRSGLWLHIIISDCSDMGIIATGGKLLVE